ncbi:MAG TPA: 3-phosphoshikimate 1-carboxyvinyltransferase [bacterium]|nr:3-phosphoshikimate 1-carboxyvinyltransferase [bacterium]
MRITCYPSQLQGSIAAIPSKSSAHRALIGSALADKPTRVVMPKWEGEDIQATIRCLTAVGASFHREENAYRVVPIRELPENPRLDCGESGSTLRFLLPVVAALGCGGRFEGSGRLPDRPIAPLIQALKQGGLKVDGARLPLVLKGKLNPGKYQLPGSVSSQFISGFLLALPLLPAASSIELSDPLESSGYVKMTAALLEEFGLPVTATARGFFLPARSGYRSLGEVVVEGDWSNMAFFLAGGAVSGAIQCLGLSLSTCQKDTAVLGLLGRFGAAVQWQGGTIKVNSRPLAGVASINAGEIPDLIPILAVVAAYATGKTHFINAARLKLKESDRLQTTAALIQGLGGIADYGSDYLTVTGGSGLKGGVVNCCDDHRIAMAGAMAALGCREKTVLLGAQAVNKSYPTFFRDYHSVGGRFHVVNNR